MNKIIQSMLKLMPLKQLIRLILDIMKYIATKTKNTTDDEIIASLQDIYLLIEPLIPDTRKIANNSRRQ